MKVWTVSLGPIKAIEVDVQKAAAINALLSSPAGILPLSVDEDIKPFAVGLFNCLRARVLPGTSASRLRRAVAAYVHTKRYYLASAQPGAMRHDLDGEAIELVSESDRTVAQLRFLELKRKHATPIGELPTAVADRLSKAEHVRSTLLSERQ